MATPSAASTPHSNSETTHEEIATPTAKRGASPYSAGGGGVSFERKVAVKYMAHLLTGETAVELGDGRAVASVAFQQAPEHPVDDLVVRACRPDEVTPSLVLAIGVRRAPNLVQSDEPTQKLIREYVRAVTSIPATGDDGFEYRLALVVSGPQPHTEQLAELADIAAKQMNASAFFELIHAPKKFRGELRTRLDHFQALVRQALTDLHQPSTEELAQQHTWTLLVRLTVLMPRFESPDEADWAELQNRLVGVARGTDLTGASRLRDRLVALAEEYPPKAATIDLTLLRRDAHAALETTVRRHRQGWQALEHLHRRALASVQHTVSSGDGSRVVHVDRKESASALLTTVAKCSATVVHGESGVGKSALVLSAIADAASAAPHDLQAVFINLRHLPSTTLDFERALGSPLSAVLGELSAPQRYIAVDGADAIAEGADESFRYLIDAAHTSNLKVVAICARDSKQIVHDGIVGRFGNSVEEYVVGPLTDAEVDTVIETFTELSNLSENARSRALLRRLVVVDLLVRSGVAGVPLSDADAMHEVWKGLVRRHGKSDRGSPAAREVVLLRLAEFALVGGDPLDIISMLNPEALEGLRRDGLLRIPTDDPYTVCPEFTHDEVRRYAIARLFLQSGDPTSKLIAAGGPRWTLAAAQIAGQAFLSLPDKPANPLRGRFSRLQASFDALVDAGHGERWGDVPGEALLTMSIPALVLRDAWPDLRAKRDLGLKRLARLVGQRHTKGGIVSTIVIEPLVCHILEDGVPSRPDDHVFELLRDWLRAHVVARTSTGHSLRIRLEKQLVESSNKKSTHSVSERILELIALLGPDLGKDGEALLRKIGAESPWTLQPVVESFLADQALALLNGSLLADMTEAYYIDDGEEQGFPRDGIRDHDARSFGILSPLAAWYLGPFMPLFQSDFRGGVEVLNRMLNHAAAVRARTLAMLNGSFGEDALSLYRNELSITGERAVYIGDSHVWFWYRGTGVGPYPCMSALQALERVCDQFIEAGAPLANLTSILLDGCENLAMVGLVVGLLVRHLKNAGRLLDPYFVEPLVWRLEFARVGAERQPIAASSEGIVSPERRRWHLRDAAMRVVLVASEERATELRGIGGELVENECLNIAEDIGLQISEVLESDDPEVKRSLAEVRVWAACLDRMTYSAQLHDDGIIIQSKPPDDAVQVLEPDNEDALRGQEAIRLTLSYCIKPKTEGSAVDVTAEELAIDLAVARELLERPPAFSANGRWDVPTAVAAVALEAHLLRGVALSEEWLEFASDTVLRVCEGEAGTRMYESERSYFERGGDRSAARVIPLLLLPVAQSLRSMLDGGDGQHTFQRALKGALSSSRAMVNEVRLHLARGLDHVWETACAGQECQHEAGLRVAVESMRDCVHEDWNPDEQRVSIIELKDPVDESLADSPDDRIIFTRLDAAIRALASAAVADICVSSRARDLLLVMFGAQRRALLSYKDNLDDRGSHSLVSARAMLLLSNSGEGEPIFDHIDAYADNPALLGTFLQALSAAAEEDPTLAAAAQALWPTVIRHVLALESAGHATFSGQYYGSRSLGSLIPNAAHESSYLYREVAEKPIVWWKPDVLLADIDTWVKRAAGDATCLDRLIAMLGALSLPDQLRLGLSRVAALVRGNPVEIAPRSYLISDWLIKSQAHVVDAGLRSEWQQVVDALVVAGASSLAPYST